MVFPTVICDKERHAFLQLVRSDNIGPVTLNQLLQRYQTPSAAIAAIPELAKRGGRAIRLADPQEIDRELELGLKCNAHLLLRGDPEYPHLLGQIHAAPSALWVLGDLNLLQRRALAVVGARNASALGCKLAEKLAQNIGKAGYCVVSGMARGIDSAAHKGAYATGTIAILGGGADVIYPAEATSLYERLCEKGAVISENPFGYPPKAKDFPRRNRIIAGLCLGVIAVEAAEKSGSLITTRFALEANREVMAAPGSPFDPRSSGCNLLIRQGATLIRHADDILQALSQCDETQMRLFEEETRFETDILHSDTQVTDALRQDIKALLSPTPTEIDEIMRHSQAHPSAVALILLELDLAGKLYREVGGKVALLPE